MTPHFDINIDETTFGRCRLAVEGEAFEVEFSDTTDAVGDLLCAVTAIVIGQMSASCRFDQEPGCHIWRFTARGPGPVTVAVWDEKSDRRMFQAKAARDDIGRALLSEIDRLKQELGVDGYMDAFDQPFPARAAEALRAALAVEQPERRGVGFNSSEFYETRFDSKA